MVNRILIDFALSFLSSNLSDSEVLDMLNGRFDSNDHQPEEKWEEKIDLLRNEIENIKTAFVVW